MTGNPPNLAEGIKLELSEAEKAPNRINSKKSTLRQILVKLQKMKNRKSENNEEGMIPYLQGKNNLNYNVFFIRSHGAGKEVAEYSQVLKEEDCQPRNQHPV